ncbi:MAG: gamma-glutamyltransferase [Caulobacterales bacterium]|nr:gamma-glutamyltransferase [Caulobacterales bacterium]
MASRGLMASALALALAGCATPVDGPGAEPLSGMVASAHPDATAAGLEILRAGGSAVDAAIAVEAVLSLVEPQSSGFGGGAFLIHYDSKTGAVTGYDGRERAPAGATPDMFLGEDGEPWGFLEAKNSGVSIGTPSVVSMLHLAHQDLGALEWGELFGPAIALSEGGFAVSERLANLLDRFARFVPATPEDGPTDLHEYLFIDGAPVPAGHIVTNPAYADTLRAIAEDPRALHAGPIAEAVISAVRAEPRSGTLSLEDLAAYEPRRVDPICTPYRGLTVCGMPPPASGGVAIGMFLQMLEATDGFSPEGADDPANWALFVEAQRLMYADRDKYVADDEFVDVPVEGLLNGEYLAARAGLISAEQARETALPGDPWAHEDGERAEVGADATDDRAGTTHFVVVDGEGDVVSMTATVESIFGSTRMAGGMILNNQLTDFSFRPVDADGAPIANAVAPGKRPRSSMSPTIVLDEKGEFLLATGSPGGNSIIGYVSKNLVAMLDWGLSPQEAAGLPNVVARGDTVRVERARAEPALIEALRAFGLDIKESDGEASGVHTVRRLEDGALVGGADPRRGGLAASP